MNRQDKKDRLSILHLVYIMGSGGIEEVVTNLTLDQKQRGCDVAIACLYGAGCRAEGLRASGIEVLALNLRTGLGLFNLIRPLGQICAKRRVDILHVHATNIEIPVTIVKLWRRIKKVILTVHAPTCYQGLRKWRARLGVKIGGCFFTKIVTVSEALKQQQISHVWRKPDEVKVIVNGIDMSRFTPGSIKPAERIRFLGLESLAQETFVVGMAVQLKGYKDIPTAMRAAARVKMVKGKEVLFVVAGIGPLEAELKDLAKQIDIDDCFKFVGRITDMPNFLRSINLLVLTSKLEGLGIVAVEAMATALPVVTTDSVGVRDCVVDGQTGIMVPVGDDKTLAESIVKLIDDRELAHEMGRAGMARAREDFTLEKCTQRYWDLLADADA